MRVDKGPFMMTVSGRRFHFDDPDPASVVLSDVMFALEHIHRYTGHVGPYSVASHSVHVWRYALELGADEATARAALLHDAHEAYVGDVSTPLKLALGAVWHGVEARAAKAVALALGIGPHDEALVRKADRGVTHAEARAFLGDRARGWATQPWSGFNPTAIACFAATCRLVGIT